MNYYARMMAVANKLVRQVYGIVQSGVKYEDGYGLEIASS